MNPRLLYDTRRSNRPLDKESRRVQVSGVAGTPASGVAAVVLSVTVIKPTSDTYLTVWPAGASRPSTSPVTAGRGRTHTTSVVTGLGRGGAIRMKLHGGTADVRLDVTGYFLARSRPGLVYHPSARHRILDTRDTNPGRMGAGHRIRILSVPRLGGVDPAKLGAVLLNVTSFSAEGRGRLSVGSAAARLTGARALSYGPGRVSTNRVMARVSDDGRIKVVARGASAHVLVDVVGWFSRPSVAKGLRFTPLAPQRVIDSRRQLGLTGSLPASDAARVKLAGAVIPSTAKAAFLNVTALGPARSSVTLWRSDRRMPRVADLTTGGTPTTNLVAVPVAKDGTISMAATRGETDVVADLVGFWGPARSVGAPIAAPSTTPSPPPSGDFVRKYSIDLPPGQFWWGAAHGGNTDPRSWEASLGQPLSARRTYHHWPEGKNGLIKTLQEDKAAGRLSALAVKFGDWATVASGARDAQIRDFVSTVGQIGVPVLVTPHHEPEGDGPPAEFRAMIAHLLPMLKTAPNITVGICLMSYTFQPFSGRNPADYWVPGVDVLGLDGYNYWNAKAGGEWKTPAEIFGRAQDFADARGVRTIILETGVQPTDGVANPPGSSYQWMYQLRQWILSRNVLGSTYFNSTLNSVAPWTLDGERLRAFDEILAGPGVAWVR